MLICKMQIANIYNCTFEAKAFLDWHETVFVKVQGTELQLLMELMALHI